MVYVIFINKKTIVFNNIVFIYKNTYKLHYSNYFIINVIINKYRQFIIVVWNSINTLISHKQ